MKLIITKVSGATIIEGVVALLIIMTVFTVSIMIYTRVTTSAITVASQEAIGESELIIQSSIGKSDWAAGTFIIGEIEYRKTVTDYLNAGNVKMIKVEAYQGGHRIGVLRQVVRTRTLDYGESEAR